MEGERSNSRVDNAIDKLTDIAVNLKALVAAHEVRILQGEKVTSTIADRLERRRDEIESQEREIYKAMSDIDAKVLKEINSLRDETSRRFDSLSEKINSQQRYIWMAVGGGIVATWIINEVLIYFQAFDHVGHLIK
jgi:SMC interacting uncharacterized protein involved in chromosome segregation